MLCWLIGQYGQLQLARPAAAPAAHAAVPRRGLSYTRSSSLPVCRAMPPAGTSTDEPAPPADGDSPAARMAGAGAAAVRRRRTTTANAVPVAPATTEGGGAAGSAPGTSNGVALQAQLAELKVTELQERLAALGLPRSGRKADLVQRLIDHHHGSAAMPGSNNGAPPLPSPSGTRVPAAAAAAEPSAAATAKSKKKAPSSSSSSSRRQGAGSSSIDDDDGSDGEAAAGPVQRDPRVGAAATAAGQQEQQHEQQPVKRRRGSAAAAAASADADVDAPAAPSTSTPDVLPTVQGGGRRTRSAKAAAPAPALMVVEGHGDDAEDDGASLGPRSGAAAAAAELSAAPSSIAEGPLGRERRSAEPERRPAETAAGARVLARSRDGGREAEEEEQGQWERRGDCGDSGEQDDVPPDLTNLPPWPASYPGRLLSQSEVSPIPGQTLSNTLMVNVWGCIVTAMGTAAVQATSRHALWSLAINRGKDAFVFDVGDDTQRQLNIAPDFVRPSKIYRIFLTSLAPESVLGLPGLLCTINSSRERGHELADVPVHICGPPGTADFIATMMRISQTCLDLTILVHEVCFGPVSEEEAEPRLYARKARIWRVLMAPDQLNPRGGIDCSLLSFAPSQGRYTKKRGRTASGGVLAYDPRAGFLPWPPLQPGDPDRREPLGPLDMRWTLEVDISCRIIANMVPAAQPTLAYTMLEADRAGGIVVERCTAAGIRGGREFARLKGGETITNRWGQAVAPETVVSPVRPGRRVVVLGNTWEPGSLLEHGHEHARNPDLLLAGATWAKDQSDVARTAGGCTADVLGEAARRMGARNVLLSRFDGRCLADDGTESAAAAPGAPAPSVTAAGGAGADGSDAAAVAAARAPPAGTPKKLKQRPSPYVSRVVEEVAAVLGADTGPVAPPEEAQRRVLALADLGSAILEKNE